MVSFLLFFLGLCGLWGGTVLTIRGAVELSERYGLSHAFVGLAVLAIGTDLPELVVALGGSLQQLRGTEASGLIVGSAYGSAVTQGTLVLGVAGLFGYLPVAPRMVKRDGVVLLLAIGLATVLTVDGVVTRLEGGAMILAYAMYFVALLQAEQQEGGIEQPAASGAIPAPLAIAIGLVTLSLGAHVVVTEGIRIASMLGMSQTLIGILFVAIGTSLPELALTVHAAAQHHASLSVGNVIGSNIFDLLMPVGIGAAIVPLNVARETVLFDMPALGITTVALIFFLVRRRGLQRIEAVALLGLYVGYLALRITTGWPL